jgi:hypothetical protein
VVAVASIKRDDRTEVLVAPVTHTEPENKGDAVEIPANVRRHLGLDRARCWIVLTELNRFIWPGPDIRIAPGSETPFYDALPDWLFFKVREGILRHARGGGLKVTKRTE